MSAQTAIEAPAVTTWKIDPAHSVAEFKVKHMMVSNVKGQFTRLQGELVRDEADLTNSQIEASVEAASLTTREPDRDAHLRSADFFDVEKYPTLSFKSRRITRDGDGGLKVAGDLTIHGITRPVQFAVEGPTAQTKDPWGGTRMGASLTTKINRKDFGLTWNAALETGGVLVGEEVAITVEVEFIKA